MKESSLQTINDVLDKTVSSIPADMMTGNADDSGSSGDMPIVRDSEHDHDVDVPHTDGGGGDAMDQSDSETSSQNEMHTEAAMTAVNDNLMNTHLNKGSHTKHAPPSPHRAGSIIKTAAKTNRQFMMQKLARTGSGGVLAEQQRTIQSASSAQSQQVAGGHNIQNTLHERIRSQASMQSSARLPAGGGTGRRMTSEGEPPAKRAYNNDKILNNLQSAYQVSNAVRASRSAGTDGTGTVKGTMANNGNSNAAMLTRKAASAARVASANNSSAVSSRFLPRLGGSGTGR